MKSIVIFFILGFFVVSCKKEQPQMTLASNACECLGEIRSNFEIGQYWEDGQGEQIEFINLDTIHSYITYEQGVPPSLNSVLVHFRAKNKDATFYEWQIGSNSITYDTPEVDLYFNDTVGTIPVRLITYSDPRPECFPNDDGIDTIFRDICIKTLDPPPLIGTYSGYLKSNPSQLFEIRIDTFTNVINGSSVHYGVSNLPEGNGFDELGQLRTTCFGGIYEGFGSPGEYYRFDISSKPKGILRNGNELRIQFSAKKYSEDGNWTVLQTWDNDEFIGIKQ